MDIRAIIYDCDGVVIDSYHAGLRRIRVIAATHDIGWSRETRSNLQRHWGMPGVELLEEALGVNRSLAERMYRDWEIRDELDPVPLVPGAREVLHWANTNKFVCCLQTSRSKHINVILEKMDLAGKFQIVTTREDVTHSKPDKRALRPTLEALRDGCDISKNKVLFVGDTPADIECGVNAKINTLLVQTGPYLLKHAGDLPIPLENVLRSIDDVPLWVEEHLERELDDPYV